MAITDAEPPARLLDLTRLTSRAGRQHTGVDRVERAYIDALLEARAPLYGLVRTALGYLLLDPAGCAAFRDRLARGEIGRPSLFSRLARRRDPARAGMESDLRRDAVARCRRRQLGVMLARALPGGTSYLNVGHSNLSPATLAGLKAVPGLRIAVMIHDTIPLDLPEMQRPGTANAFRALFTRVMAEADLVIANSAATARDIARHASAPPEIVTAPLGVPAPRPGSAPAGAWTGKPYFVALGTIEPRKNHALLLDLWEEITAEAGEAAPHLLIIGARGWRNEAVFARVDAGPLRVHELSGLDDGAVFALVAESRGLLFPSLAEGFGLPPVEAAQLGVPVLCNTLPVLKETLGGKAIYADVGDRYLWRETITRLARNGPAHRDGTADQSAEWHPPDWQSHLNTVLSRA